MIAQRELVPEGSAIAKALEYSLERWIVLMRYLKTALYLSTLTAARIDPAAGTEALELAVCMLA